MTDTTQKQNNSYMIPGAIIVAGALVAGAVLFGGNSTPSTVGTTQGNNPPAQVPPSGSIENIRPITQDDHILGNPDAPVKVVEYSDFECPFCKRFHETMNSVIEAAGDDRNVAWVYRHFPLDQLHPKNARRAAVASECANELGGNDAFWAFTNGWFEVSPTNDRTDFDAVVSQLVREIGLDENAFDTCLASGKYDEHIQSDVENAIATGGRGTPWSIVVGENGKTFPLSGAQPISQVNQLIDLASQ